MLTIKHTFVTVTFLLVTSGLVLANFPFYTEVVNLFSIDWYSGVVLIKLTTFTLSVPWSIQSGGGSNVPPCPKIRTE